MGVVRLGKRSLQLAARWPRFMAAMTRAGGYQGFRRGIDTTERHLVVGVSRNLVREGFNPGTPIWEEEWDVLVILDACRLDLMREAASHPVVGGRDRVGSFWSLASKSSNWMRRNFTEEYREEIERTAMVTGNPFTAEATMGDGSNIMAEVEKTESVDLARRNIEATGRPNLGVEPHTLVEVWKTDWDDDLSTVSAEPVTDHAIRTWRNRPSEVDRMIVHYMQPHGPFVPRPDMGKYGDASDFGGGFGTLFGLIGRELTVEEVWTGYRENLEYVLDHVAVLLDNVDAETVVLTADHGNAVGEWGTTGHPWGVMLPCLRRVPWVVTTAQDRETHRPSLDEGTAQAATEEGDLEQKLRDLGYR